MRLNQMFALKMAAVVTGIASLFPLQGLAAEKFPTKPIQVIIPFQPGDTDNLLRPFVERMGEFLGQSLSLVYKPGAAGAVGAGFVATSKPDGYVLVGTSHSSIAVVPLTNKQVSYSLDSFEPIASLVESGSLLVVLSSSPWMTFKDLIDASKKAPGKITYTSSGTFGTNHLIPEGLAKEAGVKWNHIPSQGSGPAITATLGGHVNMASTAVAPAPPHLLPTPSPACLPRRSRAAARLATSLRYHTHTHARTLPTPTLCGAPRSLNGSSRSFTTMKAPLDAWMASYPQRDWRGPARPPAAASCSRQASRRTAAPAMPCLTARCLTDRQLAGSPARLPRQAP